MSATDLQHDAFQGTIPHIKPRLDQVLYFVATRGFVAEVFAVMSASATLWRESSLWQAGGPCTPGHPLHPSARVVNTRRGRRARTLLACAAARGSVARIRELLDLGADPSLPGAGGRTPMIEAVAGRNTAAVVALLACGTLYVPFSGKPDGHPVRAHAERFTAAVSAEGALFTTCLSGEPALVWDMSVPREPRLLARLMGDSVLHAAQIMRCVLPLPDGALAIGIDDGTVRVWRAPGSMFEPPRILRGHSSTIWSMCALPGGRTRRLFATASFDCTVRIWDYERPDSLAVLHGHTDFVLAVAVTSNGLLASSSRDHTIRLWDIRPLTEGAAGDSVCPVDVLSGHTGWVESLVSLRCGALASASDDGSVRIWRLEAPSSDPAVVGASDTQAGCSEVQRPASPAGKWTCATVLQNEGAVFGLRSMVQLVDGRLAVGSLGPAVVVWHNTWEASDSTPPAVSLELRGHTPDGVHALAVLPDGRLVSGCAGGIVRVWA
jgi:hypothetical protein